jgi:hypothetical protein
LQRSHDAFPQPVAHRNQRDPVKQLLR